jgi:hypothetical protein
MAVPRHIRVIHRTTTVVVLLIVASMVTWLFTGMPPSVEAAITDALWAPCPPRYAAATTAQDSADVDGVVLKPRSRFERAITCGSFKRHLDSLHSRAGR